MICLKYQNGHISGKCYKKSHKLAHPPVLLNNVPVKRCSIQKHLGIHLDEKLNFSHLVKKDKITKANKVIGVIKKLYK